jgi:hypothetical protein
MIDWTKSMKQSFEYYVVDPATWADTERLNNVTGCSITRDSDSETLGSAKIDCIGALEECYVRAYLIATQNGVSEREPLGTFLVQTPRINFDGKTENISLDAYTPLLELKETQPPLGYAVARNRNILEVAETLIREHARAPVTESSETAALSAAFIANTNDTWLSFLHDLLSNAQHRMALEPTGEIVFEPIQDAASLQPVWTYDSGNSSILSPAISLDRDLYGIPNVVEVVYTSGSTVLTGVAVNDDPDSPTSTVSRGRRIVHRDTNPSIAANTTQQAVTDYAEQLLRDMSNLEYTVSYSHGYCPVRVGDCVMLNYEKSGLYGIRARVVEQRISCTTGCQVQEKAVFNIRV